MNRSKYFLGVAFLGFTLMIPRAESTTECKDILGQTSKSVAEIGKLITDNANRVGGLKGELKGKGAKIALEAGFKGLFGANKEEIVKEGVKGVAIGLKNDAKTQADKFKAEIKKIRESAACGIGKLGGIGKLLGKKKSAESEDKATVTGSAFHKDQMSSAPLLFTTDSDTPEGDVPSDSAAAEKNYDAELNELEGLEGAETSMANAASNISKIMDELAVDPENPELQEKLALALDEADALADSVDKEAADLDTAGLDW